MTKKYVFEYNQYKSYLNAKLSERGARSGLRAKFAKAIQCQSSFVSQILHTDLNLSLEQACLANEFFEHDSREAHYFMLLVQKERAGSLKLRKYFQRQIQSVMDERSTVKSRVPPTHELTEAQQGRYYSEWDYIAIHIGLAVPGLNTPQSLAHVFQLPVERVESILKFLVDIGMVEYSSDGYRAIKGHLHLGQDSPFLRAHHTNWRLEVLKRLKAHSSETLHYSTVYSLSRSAYAQLKENLLSVIKENLEVVKPSSEEIVVCQLIDLFPLTGVKSS